MRREPMIVSLLRLMMSALLIALVIMVYWSSTLVEERVGEISRKVSEIERQIRLLDQERIAAPAAPQAAPRPHIDASLPNLLVEDPFYSSTLPKLLPPGFKPQGTFHADALTKPFTLHPFNNWSHISIWLEMCRATVASPQFGKYETMAPSMAIKMEMRRGEGGVPEFWVHLRDGAFWAPLEQRFFSGDLILADWFLEKHQVTADDFKLWFDAVMSPYNQEPGVLAARAAFSDIEELRVVDPLTFVVRWRSREVAGPDGVTAPQVKYAAKLLTGGLQPLPSFVYKYFADGTKIIEGDDYRNSSIWAQNFSQHWAKNIIPSCGPWLFDGMNDRQILFRRNPHYFEPLAALGEGSQYTFRNSLDSMWQDFKSGALDSYPLQADQLAEFEDFLNGAQYAQQASAGKQVERLDYLARAYYYIGWNQAKPYFTSRKVRQAMTMAIDRLRIIDQNLNGMGVQVTGPLFSGDPSVYDGSIEPWPFDPKRARRLLEEEGWYDKDGDGIVEKEIDGKRVPFIFDLTYYVKTPTTKAICDYIATALKKIGVLCNLNGVDLPDLSAAFEGKSFDALMIGWGQGSPPEDNGIRQLWHSSGAKEPGSSNGIGFVNAEVDKLIEQIEYEHDPQRRKELFYRFDAIIHEEQPYTFLYAPKMALLYRSWLQNVFVPADRQDLIPGANMGEPQSSAFWLKK